MRSDLFVSVGSVATERLRRQGELGLFRPLGATNRAPLRGWGSVLSAITEKVMDRNA